MTDTSLPPAIGCRPVDPSLYSSPRLSIWNGIKASGIPEPPVYPGSQYARCQECSIEILVGPRQQEMLVMAAQLGVVVDKLCLVCAAVTRGTENVTDLGNPYQARQ